MSGPASRWTTLRAMSRWRCSAAWVLWALAMGAQAADRLPLLAQDARIVAFGDSLTDGVGGSGETYPERLAARIDRVVINAGRNGETTAQGRIRLPGVLREHTPALMILCLGTNDLLHGVPREQIRGNLVAMLETAREAGVPVLLLAVPAQRGAVADPLFAEAARAGEAVLDERSMVEVLTNAALKADLVHPNAEGYRQLAGQLATTLRDRGALTTKH